MQETVGNALSPGAGRFIDFIYPNLSGQGPSAPNSGYNRLLGVVQNVGVSAASGATTSFIRDAAREADYIALSTSATVNSQSTINGMGGANLHIATKKGMGMRPGYNELAFYRLWATLFMPNGVGPLNDNLHDFGFQCAIVGIGEILASSQWGWGFQLVDANTVQFISRDGAGLVTTPITAAPFDVTLPHVYEMRIQQATTDAEAQMQVLIDGAPIALPLSQSSWAPATRRLPPNINGSGSGGLGWNVWIINRGGQICTLGCYQVRVVGAPSLLATF